MSSTGEKKRRTSTPSPTNNSTSLPSLNSNTNGHSILPDFGAQFNSMSNSPLLLVAAMASAWHNSNPTIFQRLQQQIRLQQQQQQDQSTPQKEEKVQIESKKTKRKSDDSDRSNEKIDIIDYAKIIGNRAAGREFNVAESSIREWRKNEERLRKQSESAANGNQRVEFNHMDLIEKLDDILVEYVEGNADVDWYAIRDKAIDLWPQVIKGTTLEGSQDSEMQITMGWVTRFMKRNETRVRRIAPPVIATANAANNHNGSVSMVRKEPSFGSNSANDAQSEKTTVASSHTNSTNPSPTSSPSPVITNSRRKCAQPRRAVNATLLLTPETEKPSSTVEEKEDPEEKRAKLDEDESKDDDEKEKVKDDDEKESKDDDEKESKSDDEEKKSKDDEKEKVKDDDTDSSIKVC